VRSAGVVGSSGVIAQELATSAGRTQGGRGVRALRRRRGARRSRGVRRPPRSAPPRAPPLYQLACVRIATMIARTSASGPG
jgi:hypothetical protein